jgi:hypothetical protein
MKCRWTGCTGPVDYDRAVVHGSMVDHGRRRSKGSPERGLGAALVSGSSPAVGEKEKGASGVPTVGEGGRCSARGRPATVDQNGGDFFSWTRSLEPRETMRNAAMVCGEGGGAVRRLL